MSRDAGLQEIGTKLLKLDHEILWLKFTAAQAAPQELADGYLYINDLRDQYNALESQYQALKQDEGEAGPELFTALDESIEELANCLETVGVWARFQFANSSVFSLG